LIQHCSTPLGASCWKLSLVFFHISDNLGFSLRKSLGTGVPSRDLRMVLNPCKDISAASRFVAALPQVLRQSLAPCHLVHIFACLHHLRHCHLALEAPGVGQGVLGSSFCSIEPPSTVTKITKTSRENPSASPFGLASQLLPFFELAVHLCQPS